MPIGKSAANRAHQRKEDAKENYGAGKNNYRKQKQRKYSRYTDYFPTTAAAIENDENQHHGNEWINQQFSPPNLNPRCHAECSPMNQYEGNNAGKYGRAERRVFLGRLFVIIHT
jgi:hypothetical protein